MENALNALNSPHGHKLPTNKAELINKVESWRQARRDRLALRLMKNHTSSSSCLTNAVFGLKSSEVKPTKNDGGAKTTEDKTMQKERKDKVLETSNAPRVTEYKTMKKEPKDKVLETSNAPRVTVFDRLFQSSKKKTDEEGKEKDASRVATTRKNIALNQRSMIPTKDKPNLLKNSTSLHGTKVPHKVLTGIETKIVGNSKVKVSLTTLSAHDKQTETRYPCLSAVSFPSQSNHVTTHNDSTSLSSVSLCSKTMGILDKQDASTSKTATTIDKQDASTSKTVPTLDKQDASTYKTVPILDKQDASTSKTVPTLDKQDASTSKTVPTLDRQDTSTSKAKPILDKQDASTSKTVPTLDRQDGFMPKTVLIHDKSDDSTSKTMPIHDTSDVSSSVAMPIYDTSLSSCSRVSSAPQMSHALSIVQEPKNPKDEVVSEQATHKRTNKDRTGKSVRRSISMIHTKGTGSKDSAIHRTERAALGEITHLVVHDTQDLRRLSIVPESPDKLQAMQGDDTSMKTVLRRRSKSVTFATPRVRTPTSGVLKDNLESWLNARGKTMSEFKHLSCFGLHNPVTSLLPRTQTPYKPAVTPVRSTSETSFMSPNTSAYATAPSTPWSPDSDKENNTPPTAFQQVPLQQAKDWLTDLHTLIVKYHYPYEACDAWLTTIRRQCSTCTNLPVYWECLASLEESRGDMNTAIEFYERAIIKGAEVEAVMGSLGKLFEKFVQVNPDQQNKSKNLGVDPKNIFTSTIIKFALQQKAVKSLSSSLGIEAKALHYVMTPVRRSARISTPRSNCFKASLSSLATLTPEVKANVKFLPNPSLLPEN